MSEPNRQYHQALSANRKLLDEIARLHLQFANSEQENTRLNNYIERLEVRNAVLVPENARLKAEVERLTSDLQMEKENKDRLVREWQKANNEVYGLQTQVAALIDDQTRLQAEVERLDTLCKQLGKQHSDISCENIMLRKVGDEMAELFGGDYSDIDGVCYDKKWNAAKEGKPSV